MKAETKDVTMDHIITLIQRHLAGIGGTPSNQELYNEFDDRLRAALGVEQREILTDREIRDEALIVDPNDNAFDCFISGAKWVRDKLLKRMEYWKTRCGLAEKYIDASPCDPDIFDNQADAYHKWIDFKSKEEK